MVGQARVLQAVHSRLIGDVTWAEEKWRNERRRMINEMRREWEGRQGKLSLADGS